MTWTETEIARFQELYRDGLSHSAIGRILTREFGRVITRNATIGKAAREGYPERAPWNRRNPDRKPPASKPLPPPPPPPVVDPAALDDGAPVTVLTVRDGMCKWPIGDPLKPDFHFCGRKARACEPYCPGHMATAYRAPVRRMSEEEKRRRSLLAKQAYARRAA